MPELNLKASTGLVEGVSNEVFLITTGFVVFLITLFVKFKSWVGSPRTALIHPESETAVTAIRQRLEPRSSASRDSTAQCPVCLDSVQYGLETNCGHLFCGSCIITYWQTGRWLGPIACPNCRQTVTILLNSFTAEELQEDSEAKNRVLQEVRNYNRRFSGEPRTIWEYIQDLPTIFRHAIGDLFSEEGMVFVFRARIYICLTIAVLYLLSPLDIIPEMAVGILGLLDDLVILFLLALYISMIYRSVVAQRASATLNPHED
ncbi:hypothetical protein EB796_002435 [Bugula neritina]|uniref:E3 ubiquitin-protein ligase RNF170 n=1 Tax=Bugula neritina TaxID=10212 RepID=A0A7J7KM54_BUGNE|nr:hypothetical protein EB796_002435 [Bugula neritina]